MMSRNIYDNMYDNVPNRRNIQEATTEFAEIVEFQILPNRYKLDIFLDLLNTGYL